MVMVNKKAEYMFYAIVMLLGGLVGAYMWYQGGDPRARSLLFLGLGGSLLFLWKARKVSGE